jgi:hypothetical protein
LAIAVIILTAMGLDQATQTLMQTQQDNSGMTVHSSDDKFLTRDELQQKATAAEFNEQMPLSEALLSQQLSNIVMLCEQCKHSNETIDLDQQQFAVKLKFEYKFAIHCYRHSTFINNWNKNHSTSCN